MDFVIANQEKVNAMIKTTLKIDGMMCGMCESHMNELVSYKSEPYEKKGFFHFGK